jgi:hypothetical protein
MWVPSNHKFYPTPCSPQPGSAAQVVPAVAPKVKQINQFMRVCQSAAYVQMGTNKTKDTTSSCLQTEYKHATVVPISLALDLRLRHDLPLHDILPHGDLLSYIQPDKMGRETEGPGDQRYPKAYKVTHSRRILAIADTNLPHWMQSTPPYDRGASQKENTDGGSAESSTLDILTAFTGRTCTSLRNLLPKSRPPASSQRRELASWQMSL